jgi:hypothetical protein
MVEQQDVDLQQQRLEVARQKLTDEQRKRHDEFCALLQENEGLTPDNALKAVQIIATERGVYQTTELRRLAERAQDQVIDDQKHARAEDDRRAVLAQKYEQQLLAQQQEQEARRLAGREREQEQERLARAELDREAQRVAAHEAARREPIPGAVERFNATLAQSQSDRVQAQLDTLERLSSSPNRKPNYTRFEGMKREESQKFLEVSENKVERLAKLDAAFARTDEKQNMNQHGRPNGGNGGKGGRSGR